MNYYLVLLAITTVLVSTEPIRKRVKRGACSSIVYTGAKKDFNLYKRKASAITTANQNDNSAGTAPYDANYEVVSRLGGVATTNVGCTCFKQITTLHKDADGIIDTLLVTNTAKITEMAPFKYVDKTTAITDKMYVAEAAGDCGATVPLHRFLDLNYNFNYLPYPSLRQYDEIIGYIFADTTTTSTTTSTTTTSTTTTSTTTTTPTTTTTTTTPTTTTSTTSTTTPTTTSTTTTPSTTTSTTSTTTTPSTTTSTTTTPSTTTSTTTTPSTTTSTTTTPSTTTSTTSTTTTTTAPCSAAYTGTLKDLNLYTRTSSAIAALNDHSAGTAPYDSNYGNPTVLGSVATTTTGCDCTVQLLTIHKDDGTIIDNLLVRTTARITEMAKYGYVDHTNSMPDKIYCTKNSGDCGATIPLYRHLDLNWDFNFKTYAKLPQEIFRTHDELLCYIWPATTTTTSTTTTTTPTTTSTTTTTTPTTTSTTSTTTPTTTSTTTTPTTTSTTSTTTTTTTK